jgi:hypothetical protein
MESAEVVKAKGTSTKSFGPKTANKICGDELCEEVQKPLPKPAEKPKTAEKKPMMEKSMEKPAMHKSKITSKTIT